MDKYIEAFNKAIKNNKGIDIIDFKIISYTRHCIVNYCLDVKYKIYSNTTMTKQFGGSIYADILPASIFYILESVEILIDKRIYNLLISTEKHKIMLGLNLLIYAK